MCLTDGEGMERLWSKLAGFITLIRPTSAPNRLITLTIGLLDIRDKVFKESVWISYMLPT